MTCRERKVGNENEKSDQEHVDLLPGSLGR